MTRDNEAVKIRRWADDGERVIPELGADPISRREGWNQQYALPGGPRVSRGTMNQMFREITGMLHELNTAGIPEWSPWVSYRHTSWVRWAGGLYRSLRDSGPDHGGSIIPSECNPAWVRH